MLKYIDLINETLSNTEFESSEERDNYTEIKDLVRIEEKLTKEEKDDLIMWADLVYKSKWFMRLYSFYMNDIVNKTIKGRGEIDSAYFIMAGLTLFKKEIERLSLNFEDKNK
jgi:hypothetical protein